MDNHDHKDEIVSYIKTLFNASQSHFGSKAHETADDAYVECVMKITHDQLLTALSAYGYMAAVCLSQIDDKDAPGKFYAAVMKQIDVIKETILAAQEDKDRSVH